MIPRFVDHREHADRLVRAALAAADPAGAVEAHWPDELRAARRVTLIALGKASVSMATRAAALLGDALTDGVVLTPPTLVAVARERLEGRAEVLATDHPLPTARNEDAARQVAQLAGRLTESDTLLALISGGASAQLSLPAPGITIADLSALTDRLLRSGATIHELNCVRRHAEELKGGGLARLAHPARIFSLIVSDVVGDDPATVSSGPTSPDPTTFAEALAVLDRYDARRVAPSVTARFVNGVRGEVAETLKPGDPVFDQTRARVIASNQTMLDAVAEEAARMGFAVVERRGGVEGEASEIGRDLGARAAALHAIAKGPSAILLGGETTVSVGHAPGLGGRNQELAAAAAQAIAGRPGVAVLTLATDGVDGPTDAAGAVVSGETQPASTALGVSLAAAIEGHDTHPLLDRLGALIRTGPTGVNVIDLAAALVYPNA